MPTLTVSLDYSTEAERLALESPRVHELLGGGHPKKVIVRPPKLVNLVTARPG